MVTITFGFGCWASLFPPKTAESNHHLGLSINYLRFVFVHYLKILHYTPRNHFPIFSAFPLFWDSEGTKGGSSPTSLWIVLSNLRAGPCSLQASAGRGMDPAVILAPQMNRL